MATKKKLPNPADVVLKPFNNVVNPPQPITKKVSGAEFFNTPNTVFQDMEASQKQSIGSPTTTQKKTGSSVNFGTGVGADVAMTDAQGKITNMTKKQYDDLITKMPLNSIIQQQAMNNYQAQQQALAQQQASAEQATQQLGVLTPEQKALSFSSLPSEQVNLGQIGEGIASKAAVGAAGGFVAGTAVPGVGNAVGAAVGAVGGAVVGTFSAYKTKAVENVNAADLNFDLAKQNLRRAKAVANTGIPGSQDAAVKAYNDAVAVMLQTRNTYKYLEQEQGYEWVTKIKDKQIELETYLSQTLTMDKIVISNAILKPNPNYVDMTQ